MSSCDQPEGRRRRRRRLARFLCTDPTTSQSETERLWIRSVCVPQSSVRDDTEGACWELWGEDGEAELAPVMLGDNRGAWIVRGITNRRGATPSPFSSRVLSSLSLSLIPHPRDSEGGASPKHGLLFPLAPNGNEIPFHWKRLSDFN